MYREIYNSSLFLIRIIDIKRDIMREYPELILRSRLRHNVTARHVAMALCMWFTQENPGAIGREFNRDRTTCLYAMNRVYDALDTNDQILISVLRIYFAKYMALHKAAIKQLKFLSESERKAIYNIDKKLNEIPKNYIIKIL